MMKCHESFKNATGNVNKNQVRQESLAPILTEHTHIQVTHAWKETIHQNINNYIYAKFMILSILPNE